MKKLEFVLTFALIALISVASITFGDWNPGDAAKWIQLPDLSPLGLDICVDNLNRPGGSQRVIGDDFECKSTDKITGVHLWVSYKGDPDPRPQIQGITLGIWSDNPQGPNGHSEPLTQLWTYQATPADFVERLYFTLPDIGEGWWDPAYSGWIPNADNNIWQININVDPSVAFEQQGSPDLPVIYWLTVEIQLPIESTDAIGWKTRDRWDGQYMDAAVWYTTPPIPWHALLYPAGHEYEPDKIDMAFVLTSDEGPVIDKDYGDAPEGAIAYPSLGVTGSFPTCITIGPSGYIEHGLCWAHFEMVPPPGFDFEPDGNGGLCPGFAPYDNDECFMDGDAGLIFPDAYTIQGGTVVTCPQSTASSLGNTCTTATWGANVDIYVVNNMPVIGYVNVLMDWNQSGSWGGSSSCGIAAAAEYVLQDFPVPVGFAGPLSSLMPAGTGFLLGPNPGYIWTRFMISEARLVNPQWDGSGIFEDGETEDYLLRVDYQTDYLDFGDAPDSAAAAGYPTLLANSGANHIIAGPWLGDATDSPDAEADGQPDATATGDDIDANGDDEDGVNIPILQAGQPATITFEVNGGGGTVTGWIDYDASQSWDASEQVVATNYPVNGVYNVNITVPTTAVVGQTFARFRITTQGVLGPTGSAPDGEVEDLEVYIEPGEPEPVLKFQQKPLNGPEYFGHDELSTAYRDPDNTIQFEGCYMADDFADLADTPVIKIKWWGSYIENEIMEPVVRFLIAFETDIPAVGQPGDIDYVASHPGQVLQTEIVHLSSTVPLNPGEYSETWIGSGGPPCFENLFEYEAVLENPFPEEPDTVYWIKIVALIDDPAVLARVKPALQLSGLSLCQFLKLPFAQQMEFGLQMPVTRWGWHNRDYMIMDPYASTPPAVVPGEHLAGITSEGFEVWHFQDDAVSGEMIMDESDPIMPFVYQYNWMEEYYVYSLPYCYPPPPGVDGPQDIVEFSKDLAFELYTHAPTECFDNTHADYAEWLNAGSPQCWCYKFHCYGDANGADEGSVKKGYYWVSYADLAIVTGNWKGLSGDTSVAGDYPTVPGAICGDVDRSEEGSLKKGYYRVSYGDLATVTTNWKGTTGDTTAQGDDPYAHTCGGQL